MTLQNGREVLISVRGLAKSFGGYQIWDGLNLDVYRGEILAIVGGSGQGKSVLLRVITGLVKPDMGEVELFGRNAKSLTARTASISRAAGGSCFRTGRCSPRSPCSRTSRCRCSSISNCRKP